MRHQEPAGRFVLGLVLEDVHLLQEEAEAVGEEHPGRRAAAQGPELREQLADQAGDDAAVPAHVVEVEQPQGNGPPRIRRHPLRHAPDGAEHRAARGGRQLVGILEEGLRVGQQNALALGEAGKAGAKGVDLRAGGPLLQELPERVELALLQQPVGEGCILHGVQHSQQKVRERDPIAEGRFEPRDAKREGAAHRIEMALVELRRSHAVPL